MTSLSPKQPLSARLKFSHRHPPSNHAPRPTEKPDELSAPLRLLALEPALPPVSFLSAATFRPPCRRFVWPLPPTCPELVEWADAWIPIPDLWLRRAVPSLHGHLLVTIISPQPWPRSTLQGTNRPNGDHAYGARCPKPPAFRYTGKPWDDESAPYISLPNYRLMKPGWMTPTPSGFRME